MHYLPLMMHGDTPSDSITSPFYYAFDGTRVGVCFCTDRHFAQEQLEISRQQHFTEEQLNSTVKEWGLGLFEFGSIEQAMLFVKKWNVLVPTKLGRLTPTALALWTASEPHRFIKFEDIEKHATEITDETIHVQ
jgi:hypothetical protein